MKQLSKFAIIYFYLYSTVCENLESTSRPVIKYEEVPQSHLNQIQKRENEILHLYCSSAYPIKWLLPNNSMYHGYRNTEGRLKLDFHSGYHATLHLSQLQWTDTGFYRCVPKDFDETLQVQNELAFQENRVYIYVSDSKENHLFLHLNFTMIHLPLDEIAYINCLVTDISATVELYDTSQKINLFYEEGFGFQLQPGTLEQFCKGGNDGKYCHVTCKARSIDGKSDELPILLLGEEEPTSISILPRHAENMFYLNNNVTIECSAAFKDFICKWIKPKGYNRNQGNPVYLSITKVDKWHQGIYKCACLDKMTNKRMSKQKVLIVRERKPVVKKDTTTPTITTLKGPNVKPDEINEFHNVTFLVKVRLIVPIHYTSADNFTYQWYHRYSTVLFDQIEEKVTNTDSFTINTTELIKGRPIENNEIFVNTLTLKKALANHSGEYILSIRLFELVTNYTFSLNVLAYPRLKLVLIQPSSPIKQSWIDVNPRYLEHSDKYEVWCINEGPKAVLRLMFNKCFILFDGSHPSEQCKWIIDAKTNYLNEEYVFEKNGTFQNAIIARTVALNSGTYKCSSWNGNDITIPYIVTDIRNAQTNEGFVIEAVNIDNRTTNVTNSTITIYEGATKLHLGCKIQKYDYQPVQWFHTSMIGTVLELDSFENVISEFSTKSALRLERITVDQAGKYSCRSLNRVNGYQELRERSLNIKVFQTIYPFFGNESSPKLSNFTHNSADHIFCDARGDPPPIINWYKDGKPYSEFFRAGISLDKVGAELIIGTVLPSDKGVYTCELSNYFNDVKNTYEFERDVIGIPLNYAIVGLVTTVSVLGLAIIALLIAYLVTRVKYKNKMKELERMQRAFIATSNMPTCIEDDKPINEQSKCLAYDIEYELPPKIIPPKDAPVLGRGEFGRVVDSSILIENPPPTRYYKVAVKIIPNTSPIKEIDSILNEVKIMIHIGNHINILSFIGNISTDLYTRTNSLYIFTEYCALGSLETLLRKCRQSDSYTDELPSVTTLPSNTDDHLDEFHDYLVPQTKCNYKSYTAFELQSIEAQPLNHNSEAPPVNGYLVPKTRSNCEISSKHRSHNEGENSQQQYNLCTSDLLFYCYQIVNGMEFLFSKNVIHRDLATRNILITENNVVRIADFGLAQEGNVYNVKTTNKKLPIKWLALEVLTEQRFSAFSDIWSFGIVLCEIFTLGQIPYAGIAAGGDRFYSLLKSGLRPSRPEYAPESIWKLMQQCWSEKPKDRPSYGQCKNIIGEVLKKSCQQCYDSVQSLLMDPRNSNNYHDLRRKLIDMKEAVDDGYEVPINQKCLKNGSNRYYPMLTKEKDVAISLLRV